MTTDGLSEVVAEATTSDNRTTGPDEELAQAICCNVADRIVNGEMTAVIQEPNYHAMCHYAGLARFLVLEGLSTAVRRRPAGEWQAI